MRVTAMTTRGQSDDPRVHHPPASPRDAGRNLHRCGVVHRSLVTWLGERMRVKNPRYDVWKIAREEVNAWNKRGSVMPRGLVMAILYCFALKITTGKSFEQTFPNKEPK